MTTATDLGTLGAACFPTAINSFGEVVGISDLPLSTVHRAFLYDSAGVMHDLNDLIPQNSGWVLDHATGINDLGQISGSGTIGGNFHAFLLTPTPEPIDLSLLGLGALGLLARRRNHRR